MSWTEVEEVREDQIVEYVLEEEEEEVEKLPVRPKHARITTEQQEKMLLLQSQGMSAQNIANELGLKRTTVHEALKRTNQMVTTNILKLRRMQKKRRKSKMKKEPMNDEQVDLVNQWLEEDSLLSVGALVDRLKEVCGITVSKSYVSKVIDDFTYSLKRLDLDPTAPIKQTNALVSSRQLYAKKFIDVYAEYSEHQIVFVHFAEFTLVARTNPTGEMPYERGRKRSLFNTVGCALTRKKLLQYTFQFLALVPDEYRQFYEKLLQTMKEELGLEKAMIILDEEKLSTVKDDVLQMIVDSGYEYLLFPKESAFLNPVEGIFSSWKVISRRAKPRDEKSLVKALEEAPTALLTEDDYEYSYLSTLSTIMSTYHGKWHDPQTTMSSFSSIKK